jgi:formamidopyrimidine-DNA glycosylase
MPELPEVEAVRQSLQSLILQKEIKNVEVYWSNIIKFPLELEHFKMNLIGEKVNQMTRRGKFLLFHLDHYVLVSHLRMEGKYRVNPKEDPREPHTHVVFEFTDGTELRYRDVRKFGTMHLFAKGTEMEVLPLSHLGPEPFDSIFTNSYLKESLSKTNRLVKPVLLDQKIVVGLGNIYVDETLFRAGVRPDRIASSLSDQEYAALHHAIQSTLQEAVDKGGSTIRSYENSMGKQGEFQDSLMVYGRKGLPCKVCGIDIEKSTLSGRGTHICPNCQR